MHLIKPLWLKHGGEKKDFEVYSCHVSADGLRLVTAAGGWKEAEEWKNTDGYVRLWSTEAIYNGTNVNFTKPRQLAALSYHSGTIHAVRFSPNNKYLASGADDKIVCVYVLDPNAPAHTTFGSTETPPVENWRIYRRLIGHENDVQDLGWSCDSSLLVSVGLDSRVVVWSGYTFEKLKTLSQHGSHVKGITFDPANKYFATASDDRSIRIFRYTPISPNTTAYDQLNNFVVETTIVQPFAASPLTTYFRRCSWSPDGNHIAAANAVNGQVSTAAIIERGTWDCQINLVGHEAPIEVCAFSPRIFSKLPQSKENDITEAASNGTGLTVIACAGQDRALSIWNTMSSKPLCVNDNLTTKSISDLAWSPDGESLFFTSLDGSITLARFGPGELGYPVSMEVNESTLAKYGAGRKVGAVEGPDGLLLEEKSKNDELRNVQGRMGELMGDGQAPVSRAEINGNASGTVEKLSGTNSVGVTNGAATTPRPLTQAPQDPNAARVEQLKQRVTITKDGKKRVAPVLVSSSAGLTQSSLPQTQLMSSANQSTRNDAPQNILDLSKPYDGLPKGGLATLLFGNKRKLAETGAEDDNAISQKITTMQREGAAPILMNTTEGLAPPNQAAPRTDITWTSTLYHSALTISQFRLAVPMTRQVIRHVVGGPLNEAVKANSIVRDTEESEIDMSRVFEAQNSNPAAPSRTGRAQDRDPTRLSLTIRGRTIWQDYLPRSVTLLTGNTRFWAATCDDGSVHVWTPAGRRAFNAFALEAPVSLMDCRGPWLLCITAVGMCYVWNIERASSLQPPVSLAPVLDLAAHSQGPHLVGGPGIVFARLSSGGRIYVGTTSGEGFTYSPSLFVWQRMTEVWWACGSQYWNSSVSVQPSSTRATDPEENDMVRLENLSAGIIPFLERHTTAQTLLRGRAFHLQRLVKSLLSAEGYEGFESSVSVAHLELRLAAAQSIGARDEFKLYLGMYAKRLGAEGSKSKIEELLRGLLLGISSSTCSMDDANKYLGVKIDTEASDSIRGGIPVDTTTGLHWCTPGRGITVGPGQEEHHLLSDMLGGWKKEVLLREVVLILGKFRDLHRTIVPYARLLGITEGQELAIAEDQEMDAV